MTYGNERRIEVLQIVVQNGTVIIPTLAIHYNIGEATIYKWYHDLVYSNRRVAERKRTRKPFSCIPPEDSIFAIMALEDYPLYYLNELCSIVQEQTNHHYTISQMHSALKELGYTRKILEYRALEQCQPLRALYRAGIAQFSSHQLVFFDESHVKPEDIRRKYGHAVRGAPAFLYVYNSAHGDSSSGVTGLCAMGLQGMLSFAITNQIVNSEKVLEVLENFILPNMRPYPEANSILVLDNAKSVIMPILVHQTYF